MPDAQTLMCMCHRQHRANALLHSHVSNRGASLDVQRCGPVQSRVVNRVSFLTSRGQVCKGSVINLRWSKTAKVKRTNERTSGKKRVRRERTKGASHQCLLPCDIANLARPDALLRVCSNTGSAVTTIGCPFQIAPSRWKVRSMLTAAPLHRRRQLPPPGGDGWKLPSGGC